jgi:hypothetical protein
MASEEPRFARRASQDLALQAQVAFKAHAMKLHNTGMANTSPLRGDLLSGCLLGSPALTSMAISLRRENYFPVVVCEDADEDVLCVSSGKLDKASPYRGEK